MLTPYRGVPQTRLKLEGRATQTSVVAILVSQSTHVIYHITDN